MLQVAKGLLSDFQREFRDMNLLGMVRFVVVEASTRLTDLNPFVMRKTDSAHLRSRDFQGVAFQYRADRMLLNAGRRLQRRIENDLDWYLENGYVEATKAKAIRGAVNDSCDEIRPAAEGLVDAFGIPDACLAAPIATDME